MSSFGRVRNSGSLFQSSISNLFLPGFSCFPYYWGVRKARVDRRGLDDDNDNDDENE